jgi:hypothetical protein
LRRTVGNRAIARHVASAGSRRPELDAPEGGGSGGGPSGEPAPSSAARVLQRKVGFEFETNIPVASYDGAAHTALDYQERVFTANSGHWKIVADSSNMEFVTEPFNENAGGRLALGVAMAQLVNWAGRMPAAVTHANSGGHPGTARVDAVGPTFGTTAGGGLLSDPLVIAKATLADAEILAAPQATGGVRLDQIPALVDRMVSTNIAATRPQQLGGQMQTLAGMDDADIADRPNLVAIKRHLGNFEQQSGVAPQTFATSLVGMNPEDAVALFEAKTLAVTAVDNHVNSLGDGPHPNFDKLKGLLTLVISYLLMGERVTAVMDYSKMIAPLMARTNFYALHGLLNDAEKAVFTETFVLTAAGLPGTGATGVFRAGFTHNNVLQHGPTRAAWIDSIKLGSPGAIWGTRWRNEADLLSQGSGSTAAANSSSLGSMSTPDRRVTGQRDLAVVELRRLPKEVQRLEWTAMANLIFDTIVNLP